MPTPKPEEIEKTIVFNPATSFPNAAKTIIKPPPTKRPVKLPMRVENSTLQWCRFRMAASKDPIKIVINTIRIKEINKKINWFSQLTKEYSFILLYSW